ncbi:MAG: hypothetical protein DWH79_01630 [Planctomycetota bacterium]|nr:MAG: hypothetical protein DWH79_01630 [Planctomycetota bacterium]
MGLLHFLNELQESDARRLAIEECIGGDHVAEEFHCLLVLRKFQVGTEHRQRTTGLRFLLLELFEGLDDGRQFPQRGHGVALEKQIELLLEPQGGRHEGRILGNHRHTPVEDVGSPSLAASGQRQAGEQRSGKLAAGERPRGQANAEDVVAGHHWSFRESRLEAAEGV